MMASGYSTDFIHVGIEDKGKGMLNGVESRTSKGTAFTITLPLRQDRVEVEQQPAT
jgi:hypothetical protein